MYFLVYKTTNNINGKIYIGVHQTNNKSDGYKGSGLALRRAFKKYGRENFSTEIIHECDSKEQMFQLESELVTSEFVNRRDTYNQIPGGERGPTVGGRYHKSQQHLQNVDLARQQALIVNHELKQKRIEKYNKNPKLCEYCSRPIHYEQKHSLRFCSSSCSASHSNSNRENIWTDERKRQLSKKATERYGETKASKTRQRRNEWRKQRNKEISYRIELLQQFLPVKRGWVTKASKITGIEKSYMKEWVKNNIPEQFKDFYPQ